MGGSSGDAHDGHLRTTSSGRWLGRSSRLVLVVAVTVLVAGACDAGRSASPGTTQPASGSGAVETLFSGNGLNQPSALASRPGSNEIWVTSYGDDAITILAPGPNGFSVVRRNQDAYAEHFVARPSGLAFDPTGTYFAVSNDSNNEVRNMDFKINPERNVYFKGSNFMGPTLFASATFGVAGQSKKYLDDWPQPGYGHDPPDDTPQSDCPPPFWSTEVGACLWPREGSHLDMLHGSPLSAGIVNEQANVYWVLDGCGSRDAKNTCKGDGHLVRYDFNRDHQEGNGFHGDGTITRFVSAPFTRVDGLSSGLVIHDGQLLFADTGKGVVRRVDLRSGTKKVLVRPWHDHAVTSDAQGPGIIDWSHVEGGPGDGDTPPVIAQWIATHGDAEAIAALGDRWIKPQEVLSEYAYVDGSTVQEIGAGALHQPTGLAAGPDGFFVVDAADGSVHQFAWDGTPGRVVQTGRKGLSGAAYADGAVLVTDRIGNSVLRVRVS